MAFSQSFTVSHDTCFTSVVSLHILIIIRVVEAKARIRGVAGTYRVVLQGVRGASATDFFFGKFALKRLKIALKTVKIYPY